MTRIEALADALAHLCDAHNPESEAYHLRNPILLRAFAPKHERDEKGHRVFRSFIAGYENALLDLKIKCSGRSRAKLMPDTQLINLLTTYGHQPTAIRYILKFLRKALKNDQLTEGIKLGWFMEDQDGRPDTRSATLAGHEPSGAEPTDSGAEHAASGASASAA